MGPILWNVLLIAMGMEKNIHAYKKGGETMFEGTDLCKKQVSQLKKYNSTSSEVTMAFVQQCFVLLDFL